MQRYFNNNLSEDIFSLSQEDSYHIKTVMRMKLGDKIEVVNNNTVYITKIIELDKIVKSQIVEKLSNINELEKKVTICQSLVKEQKMDLILQKCTELGAYSFIPLNTKNSIVKLDNSNKKTDRWQKIVKEASEQSKRNIIPKIENVINIKDLAKLDYDLKILCTVNEVSRSLKNVLQNTNSYDTIIIVIGPEGGFTRDEEKYLIDNGYLSTTLLKSVLRTETAGIAALSMINYELGK